MVRKFTYPTYREISVTFIQTILNQNLILIQEFVGGGVGWGAEKD